MLETNEMTKEMAEIMEIAQNLERYENAVKQMKAKLKAHVELHGPIRVNGKVWDLFESAPKWVFAPAKLRELAVEMTVTQKNPWEFLSLTSNDIKKLGFSEDVLSKYGTKQSGNKTFRSVQEKNYDK